MSKPEIGYYHRGGYRPGATMCHLGTATPADIDRVLAGAAFALGPDDVARRDAAGNAIVECHDRYHWLGGGALRDAQEFDARRIRDALKAAIRAAGYKPVRL